MRFTFAFLLLALAFNLTAQSDADREKAAKLGREAIGLMDEGKYEESLVLLREGQQLDPENPFYPYEIGFAYYLQKDYSSALKVMKKAVKSGKTAPQMYSIMGNIYDYTGKQKKAVKTYEEGIERYPETAIFHVELGILEFRREEYDLAAAYWEAGIRADPNYASNYFHLASLFSNTEEHLWTVLYGEMFLNLEPNTKRTEAISEVVYNGYRSAIKLEGDSARVDFVRNMTMTISDLTNLKLPAPMVFGTTMALATTVVNGEDDVNCTTLHKLRSGFLQSWHAEGHDEKYPNAVIERMKTIEEAGHLEAYNHWLVSMGDPVGWEFWVDSHKEEFSAFADWFNENGATVEKGKGLTRNSF